MHVGAAIIFQGYGHEEHDREIYRHDLALGDLVEPLGYESLWGVEHHFDEYTMCPDVLQHLAYFAGRTQKIQLGSMVVVLPWHNPMRVAEEVAMLDHQCDGRFVLGVGRGLARIEFEGFGLDQGESRRRFVESAQMLLEGLERGYCEFDGEFVKQVRREIRPRPFQTFRGRTYAAAISPESSEIMAKLGVALLIIPQKPWEQLAQELAEYRSVYRKVCNAEAPPPILTGWTFCDSDAGRAEECARRWIGGYWRSVVKHYELVGDHLGKIKGYESYRALQEQTSAAGGVDAMLDFFLSLQVWGTPEQCYQKVLDIRERTLGESFVGVFSYGGMPFAEAERNLKAFAKEVAPELRKVRPAAKAA
jgi:alkanesulfonate monooxygenase SsuD/methylene tetrahydromethanopterin reductase-like flavin-dependent oxidoreductase (luciferase family)